MRTGFWLLALTLAVAWLPARAEEKEKGVTSEGVVKEAFGKTPDGQDVELYTLTNKHGTVAKVMTYGATLTALLVADKDGKKADVVTGFDTLEGFLGKKNPYFGATVGRVCNRIAKGHFTLDGKEYKVAANDGGRHHLHGGVKGFDKVVWKAEILKGEPGVRFSYTSPDGEEGYPGTLKASVTYRLREADALVLTYHASTDKATPVNLTNHAYFNLSGQADGSILDEELQLFADKITASDETLVPTGELKSVEGTPFDFTKPTKIGARIGDVKGDPSGYDVNYAITGEKDDKGLRKAAVVYDPKSGRVMTVSTTEPGIQFYTGNFLDGTLKGKGGAVYKKHAAFCLETQHYPDSVNHKEFPSTILEPGKEYRSQTVYQFSTK